MSAYILRRLLQAIPVLFLITAIVFLVVYFIPGDPAMVVLGQGASPANLEAIRERLGLNQPLPIRYAAWLGNVLQGDLGASILSRQPVTTLIGRALPVTLYLTAFSLLIAVAIAVPAGILAGLQRNSRIDFLCTTWALLGISIPGFWLGIMLLYLFGVRLQWVPMEGYISPRENLTDSLRTMALPAVTLGVFLSSPLMRFLRSSVLQVMAQDYVTVARAKGVSERQVVLRHILRNSLIPFVTVLGIQLGYLFGGAIVIEQVFSLPGIGRLARNALGDRDFPVVQGVVLVVAVGIVLINVVVDLLYSFLDPRVRLGSGGH